MKYNRESNKLINKSKLLMIKSQKNKVKFKLKELSKIFNILKKKILILKLKSNSINIKSKKLKLLTKKIKGFKLKETLSSWKKFKTKSKDKLKLPWKESHFLMEPVSYLLNKANQKHPYQLTMVAITAQKCQSQWVPQINKIISMLCKMKENHQFAEEFQSTFKKMKIF